MRIAFSKYVVAVGLALSFSAGVQGVPISGSISLRGDGTSFGGGPVPPGIIHSSPQSVVDSVRGSYADAGVLTGIPVIRSSFCFNPWVAEGVIPLWHTTAGPAASFDITSLRTIGPEEGRYVLRGEGILHLAGYDPTPGSWIFRSWCDGATFVFGTPGAIPDSGATGLILGVATVGLVLLRRLPVPARGGRR